VQYAESDNFAAFEFHDLVPVLRLTAISVMQSSSCGF
jgi:hypothetical protein